MRLFEVEVVANGSWWKWTVLAATKEHAFAAVEAAHPDVDFNEHTWDARDAMALIVDTPPPFKTTPGT